VAGSFCGLESVGLAKGEQRNRYSTNTRRFAHVHIVLTPSDVVIGAPIWCCNASLLHSICSTTRALSY